MPGADRAVVAVGPPWIPWIPHNRGLGFTRSIFILLLHKGGKLDIVFKSTVTSYHLALLNESSRLQHQLNKNFGIDQMLSGKKDLHILLAVSTFQAKKWQKKCKNFTLLDFQHFWGIIKFDCCC